MNLTNASRRTFQQVHRDSRHVGTVEAELWRPTNLAERERALAAARLYELKHKQKGRRNGPLGHVGLEVLSALWNVVDFATGRLEPSLEWIMDKTGRCRDAVVTALKRLQRVGFVRWIRRFDYVSGLGAYKHFLAVKTKTPNVRNVPPVKQATNAYALDLPDDAAALLPDRRERTVARGAALQDYQLQAAQRRHRERIAAAAANRPYRADHYDGFPPLSKALIRLNELVAECESAIPGQTRFQSLLRGAPDVAGAS